jgi:hypothetical protein
MSFLRNTGSKQALEQIIVRQSYPVIISILDGALRPLCERNLRIVPQAWQAGKNFG